METAISCFMIVGKFLNIALNKDEIQSISETSGISDGEVLLLKFAKHYKLKSKLTVLKEKDLSSIKSPVIAKNKDGTFFIIAKVADNKAMVLNPGKNQPELIDFATLFEIWDGTAVFIVKKGLEASEAVFSFKWFIPTILKFKKEFIQVIVAVFVVQILGILTPVMTQVVVDKVLSHRSMSTLYVLTIGIGLVYVFDLILSLAKNYIFTHTTNRIDVMLSAKLFKHLFALPLRYFEARRTGETVARVRELDTIRQFLTGTPLSSVIDLFFIIVYIIVLFFYSTKLTLIVLASIPFYAVLSLIVTPLFKKRLDEKFNTGAETQSFLVESINGVQTIKSFSLEQKFDAKWGDLQSNYVRASYKTSMLSSTAGTLAQFIQKIFDLLILFFAAIAVMDGDFTVGQLVAFRMLAGRVSGPVLRLVQLWQEYQQASLSVKRIGDIFNSPVEPKPQNEVSAMPKLQGKIVFDKVRFRYRADASEVIKDMSFVIEPGTTVGVVGRSGSGKSTVSKLIQRLYIAENGKISIDGMNISMVNPNQLRTQIGVVLQENFMFNGTVAENIRIHHPSAVIEQVVDSAKTAGAHDFILELANGYDTIIGEKGVGLSGGQKQRVAIARAILANPKILIFDEATSALDYESESIIQKNLKQICKNRTVVIIAHRLSTLRDADKIMIIDGGKIVEYDTHDKLIEAGGLYSDLHNMQLRGDING
ncbi:peptidase C39 [Clostridia bacterium]|nr:peptidase C39 [Clostridia bacterium]